MGHSFGFRSLSVHKNSDLTRLIVDTGIQTFLFLRHLSHCSDLRASCLSSSLSTSGGHLVQPAAADWLKDASLSHMVKHGAHESD